MPIRPRFAADEMLGSLARWLRIMGYDTTYERGRGDDQILASSRSEGRTLLTRDEELAHRSSPNSLYVRSDDLDEQLREVASAFGLAADETMSRCTVCNGELDLLGRKEAEGQVPLGALESNEEFFRCDSCGKMYWKGTHWDHIRQRLDGLGIRRGNSPR